MTTSQYDDSMRNTWLQAYEDEYGTSPKMRIYDGTMPANVAAAAAGTQLIELTNATSNWRNAPSAGTSTLAGTFTGTVAANGTARYWRGYKSDGTTCKEQGLVTRAFSLTTSAPTAAASNVLTFTSTTGVSVGMQITGTGVPAGATVLAVTSTTVTMSLPSTAGVASGATIYFGDVSGRLWLQSTALSVAQTINVTVWTRTAPGA